MLFKFLILNWNCPNLWTWFLVEIKKMKIYVTKIEIEKKSLKQVL